MEATEIELDNIVSHLPKNMVQKYGSQVVRQLLRDKQATTETWSKLFNTTDAELSGTMQHTSLQTAPKGAAQEFEVEDQYSYDYLSRVMRSNTQAGSANTNNASTSKTAHNKNIHLRADPIQVDKLLRKDEFTTWHESSYTQKELAKELETLSNDKTRDDRHNQNRVSLPAAPERSSQRNATSKNDAVRRVRIQSGVVGANIVESESRPQVLSKSNALRQDPNA